MSQNGRAIKKKVQQHPPGDTPTRTKTTVIFNKGKKNNNNNYIHIADISQTKLPNTRTKQADGARDQAGPAKQHIGHSINDLETKRVLVGEAAPGRRQRTKTTKLVDWVAGWRN